MSKDIHINHPDGAQEFYFVTNEKAKEIINICSNCMDECTKKKACYCCENGTEWLE